MEKQNKKIFSTVLMMVGVLCIVVSGGIFVSRTWQYLPEVVKKLCLVAVAGIFYGGSYYLEKQGSLKKAPMALYYLGVCFTGFSVFSLIPADWMELAGRLLLAMLAMSVPVILRFLREKDLADMIIQICLTDGMILCIAQYAETDKCRVMTLCGAIFMTLLAGFVYYCKREMEEEGLIKAGTIAFAIHGMLTLPHLAYSVFTWRDFLYSVLPIFLVTGAMTALYLAYSEKVLRILQSAMLLLCGLALTSYTVGILPDGMVTHEVPTVFFSSYLIGLVLMLGLGRKELFCANAVLGFLYTFIQVIQYPNPYFNKEIGDVCYPYGIAMAVAIVFWYYFREKDWDHMRFMKFTAVYFLLGLNSMTAWMWPMYARHFGHAFWYAIFFLFMGCYLERRSDKKEVFGALCKSFSLFLALVAVLAHKILPTVIYTADGVNRLADFSVEYDCIFAGVGIVLLGKIWYSIYKDIRKVQYVGVCILLGVLLMSNLKNPNLINVLFLAIVTLGMLVISSILKNKRYAIASAVTLALVVLYLTREFWMSIAWWVYLFVAGVGLVIFAIRKEKAE